MLKNALLWKLSIDESKPSYIFGTMHVKDETAYSHINLAMLAMYKCDQFMTEIDLGEAQKEISVEDYFIPNNMTLTDFLSERHYAKISLILSKAFKLELDAHKRFLPMILINKISEIILRKDRKLPLDAFLWQEANKLNMNCNGLETINEQLSLLKSIPIDEQIKMLRKTVKNINKFRASIIDLSRHYELQEISHLYKQTKKSLGSLRKSLLYDRNEIMSKRIIANSTNATFYAVGAAHLAGNFGILSLLKKQGVKVKAIEHKIKL